MECGDKGGQGPFLAAEPMMMISINIFFSISGKNYRHCHKRNIHKSSGTDEILNNLILKNWAQ
jgi:hypothetical protein